MTTNFTPEPGTVLMGGYVVPQSGYVPPRYRPGYHDQTARIARLLAGSRRMFKAVTMHTATDGDIEVLPDLIAIRDEMDSLIADTVDGLRDQHGFSWTDIARVTNMTPQGAQQKYGRRRKRKG